MYLIPSEEYYPCNRWGQRAGSSTEDHISNKGIKKKKKRQCMQVFRHIDILIELLIRIVIFSYICYSEMTWWNKFLGQLWKRNKKWLHMILSGVFFVKTSSILGGIKAFSLTNGKKPHKKIFAFYIKIIPVILQTPSMNSPASSLEAI